MIAPFQSDTRYVRFLAGLPGLWSEVGALEDHRFLRKLTAERRVLGLPPIDGRFPVRRRRRTARSA